ncbi:hypothetical protein P7C73_g3137, partial [Tremellales sp. Uapishka_1]
MPIEVSLAPFRRQQQQLEYHVFPHNSMPASGPARLSEIGPPNIMANGLRNPYAPHAGETYMPAQSLSGGGGMPFPPMSVPIGSRSAYGDAGSGYGGSWGGSLERDHRGFAPDMTNAPGFHQAASYQNHAPMSNVPLRPNGTDTYLAPPVSHPNHHPHRARRASIQAVPIDDHDCCSHRSHSHSHHHPRPRARSGSSSRGEVREGDFRGMKRFPNSPAVNSPLNPLRLERKTSHRSHGSRSCSECSY